MLFHSSMVDAAFAAAQPHTRYSTRVRLMRLTSRRRRGKHKRRQNARKSTIKRRWTRRPFIRSASYAHSSPTVLWATRSTFSVQPF